MAAKLVMTLHEKGIENKVLCISSRQISQARQDISKEFMNKEDAFVDTSAEEAMITAITRSDFDLQ